MLKNIIKKEKQCKNVENEIKKQKYLLKLNLTFFIGLI